MNYSSRFCQYVYLVAFCAMGVCAASTPTAKPLLWWTPNLGLSSLANIDSALSKPVLVNGEPTKIVLVHGSRQKAVATCTEYLDAIDESMSPPNDRGSDTQFVERCYALRYLKSAQQARQSFIAPEWSDDVLNQLPPFNIFVEASLAEKADVARKHGESWSQFDPSMKLVSHTARNAIFQNNTNRWDLRIIAQGDFNHDGFEDQVIIACDSKTTTGGGLCFPMVLTAYAPNKVKTLISYSSAPYKLIASASQQR